MKFLKDKKAASVTELGLLAGLIAVLIIGTVSLSGNQLKQLFDIAGNNVNKVVMELPEGISPPPEPLAQSCQELFERGEAADGVYKVDLNGGDESDAVDVYCDMTRKEGGWTLVAVIADDGNNYWTWDDRSKTYDGVSVTGSVSSISTDYQGEAWHSLAGSEMLFTKANNASDYIYYTSILSNSSIGSRYPTSIAAVGEFAAADFSGAWQQECGTQLHMSLVQPDSDGNGWDEASWGFVWRSVNNNSCNYDDGNGGINHPDLGGVDYGSQELHWNNGGFYQENFGGSALQVWVR